MTYIYLVREQWDFCVNEPDEYVAAFATKEEADIWVDNQVPIPTLTYEVQKKMLGKEFRD